MAYLALKLTLDHSWHPLERLYKVRVALFARSEGGSIPPVPVKGNLAAPHFVREGIGICAQFATTHFAAKQVLAGPKLHFWVWGKGCRCDWLSLCVSDPHGYQEGRGREG